MLLIKNLGIYKVYFLDPALVAEIVSELLLNVFANPYVEDGHSKPDASILNRFFQF